MDRSKSDRVLGQDLNSNLGKPWYCGTCRAHKENGFQHSTEFDPDHTGGCTKRTADRINGRHTYACECPICWPEIAYQDQLKELDDLMASLDTDENTKHCSICKTSSFNCSCEDKQCAKCKKPWNVVRRCEGRPDFCSDHCRSDDHPHLTCLNNAAAHIVEGDWEECAEDGGDGPHTGICYYHEVCRDHHDEASYHCDHDNGFTYDDRTYDDGILISASCDECGKIGRYLIDYKYFADDIRENE